MSNLSNIWSPSHCLSKNQLIGYLQHSLDRDETYLVESHLNDCSICSDALEGFMETDLELFPAITKDIQTKIEEKIQLLHPKKDDKIIASSHKRLPTNEQIKSKPIYTIKKWLVAASILLIVGLGGYTVYSFIKSNEAEMAKNEKGAKAVDAEYSRPADSTANEISTLRIEEPETNLSASTSDKVKESPASTKETKNIVPVQVEKKYSPEAKDMKENDVVKDEVSPPSNLREKEEEQAAPATANEIKNVQAKEDLDAYLSNTKPPEAKTVIAKKSTSVGLSNATKKEMNKLPNQNNKQLSYPSQTQSNNNYDLNPANNENESVSNNAQKVDNYENGMQAFNDGNYKQSILFFEAALKNSLPSQTEDIQFHLAQAYEKIGKNKKAKQLYELLAKGKKYSIEAEAALDKASK